MLDIGHLKSYCGMGAVNVEVRGSDTDPEDKSDNGSNGSTGVVVDRLWDTHASVPGYEANTDLRRPLHNQGYA